MFAAYCYRMLEPEDFNRMFGSKARVGAQARGSSPSPLNDGHSLTLRNRSASDIGRSSLGKDSGRWTINCILMGDGTVGGFKNRRVYASSRISTRYKDWQEIDLDYKVFKGYRNGEYRLPTYSLVPGDAHQVPPFCRLKANQDWSMKRWIRWDQCMEQAYRFMQNNRNVAVTISLLGARPPSPALIGEHVKELGCIFATKMTHRCVDAAILNAICILKGKKVAQFAMVELIEKEAETCATNLAAVSRALQSFNGSIVGVRLERCPKELKNRFNKMDPFAALVAGGSGIWLVHLDGPSCKHVVVVDLGRGLIIDNEEKYPVKLTVDNLKACGGPDVESIKLVECRPMVLNI